MITIREYQPADAAQAMDIWNEVVRAENAFPQVGELKSDEAEKFFAAQSFSGVAVDDDGRVLGLCIVHPNNIGRCGVIANASYAVASSARGKGAGEALVRESLRRAKDLGFRVMQFNAVVASNTAAIRLYEKIGFQPLGTVPGAYRHNDGSFEDIRLFCFDLTKL